MTQLNIGQLASGGGLILWAGTRAQREPNPGSVLQPDEPDTWKLLSQAARPEHDTLTGVMLAVVCVLVLVLL